MKHVEEMKASRMGRQAVEVDYVWCIQQASRGLWIKDQMQQCHLDETWRPERSRELRVHQEQSLFHKAKYFSNTYTYKE